MENDGNFFGTNDKVCVGTLKGMVSDNKGGERERTRMFRRRLSPKK